MFASQWNIVSSQKRNFRAFHSKNNLIVEKESTLGHSLLPAEPINVGARRHAARYFRIVGVQDRSVALELILEHAHLRGRVLLKRRVPVEMIGSEIQQHADFRPECFDRLELEAADLGYRDGVSVEASTQREQRSSNVAADQRRNVGRLQNVRDERRRRGLAVRAGDRDELASQKSPRQLYFAPHRNSLRRARVRETAASPERRD